ncbi:site-specific DNA-methyltransferase [Ralstonia solanacearum]|nr:site-specific DNA-methyltransferase [Ralstonia solanacearum]
MPFLDWVNKNQAKDTPRAVPYHLLKRAQSYGDALAAEGNLLIQGDNLLALKALLPFYAGQVKCIFIDPPYNTKSAFEHYDDNLEHSQWLSMMYPRLVLLRELLAEDGSIWVSIDENEAHYLKVLMDEVFGRRNFIAEIIWQKRTSRENRAAIGSSHDTVLLYGRLPAVEWKRVRNLLPPTDAGFANPDNDPRGPWRSIPFSAQGFRPNQMYVIIGTDGTEHSPPKGRCWGATEPEYLRLKSEGRVYFPKNGAGRPRIKVFSGEEKGLVPNSVWLAAEVGDTEQAKKEILSMFDEETPFGTPKPESLIARVVHIASRPGDLVLDSFLGSGTTAAVAHKMGRRYIGIEMGDHAQTHCVPRLQKVIEGEQGGISATVGWQGGGGFSFYQLGEPAFDTDGRLNSDIKFSTLAAYVWHIETGTPGRQPFETPFLGTFGETAYFLLYNGILGDRRPAGGNVLTSAILAHLRTLHSVGTPLVVYGETSRIGPARLAAENITFKQVPYDISMR